MSVAEADKISESTTKSLLVKEDNVSSYALFSFLSKRDYDVNFGPQDDLANSESSAFDLISSTLDSIQVEQLQIFLAGRLKKGAVYLRTGNFFEMDFTTSKKSPTSFDTCFFIFLPIDSLKQLIICLLSATETNLETFRIELTTFCEALVPSIPVAKDLTILPHILTKLSSWYDTCVNCACRVIDAVGPDVSCLLQLAQENGKVSADANVDVALVDDVRRFVSACLVADCLSCDSATASEAVLSMSDCPGKLRVSGVISNPYCVDWGRLLLDHGRETEPWKLRRVLEAFKLKTIKDVNILNRLLKQSEMDHYSIYRTYSFLCNSGNGDILLRRAKMDQSSATDVIALLEQHLTGQCFTRHKSRLLEQ